MSYNPHTCTDNISETCLFSLQRKRFHGATCLSAALFGHCYANLKIALSQLWDLCWTGSGGSCGKMVVMGWVWFYLSIHTHAG